MRGFVNRPVRRTCGHRMSGLFCSHSLTTLRVIRKFVPVVFGGQHVKTRFRSCIRNFTNQNCLEIPLFPDHQQYPEFLMHRLIQTF
jgi:hypothetical protein